MSHNIIRQFFLSFATHRLSVIGEIHREEIAQIDVLRFIITSLRMGRKIILLYQLIYHFRH
ncbi:MAG: hypothetical protein IKO35_01355, partial [Elusimicrobiaceae bacterium]|nr:hypothetical protein [Elusimicrobiaceae bacterium]